MFRKSQQIGQYRLIKKLARGGFGEVWLAEKESPLVTKKVAVKLPLDEQVDIETIRQEATVWEEASGHPNVLPLVDADIYDGQVVIVSEFVEGGSLADKLKAEGKLSVEEAVKITAGILNGLEYLHSKKIIHRDIKPANVLMQGDTPRLADFGISRAMRADAAVSSTIIGTEAFMAPEAFEGARSEQTDIWSVGVVLYKLLTGRMPFAGQNQKETMFAVLTKEPEPLPPEIPARLREIVFRALTKNTAADSSKPFRYQTAAEMRDDLHHFLAGYIYQPVAAPAVSAYVEEEEEATKLRIPIHKDHRRVWSFPKKKTASLNVLLAALGVGAAIVLLSAFLFTSSSLNRREAGAADKNANAAPDSNIAVSAELPNDEAIKESKRLYREGDKFYRRKKYEQAIEAYSAAIELNPKDYGLYNNRGTSYHSVGEYEKAIADYTKAVELNPYDFSAYNNRGAAYEDIGNIEQAVADYRKSLEIKPNNKIAKRNLEKILR